MTLNWLTLYATYPVLSGRWGCCENYIGNTLIDYGMKMTKLARKKITFALEHDIELGCSVNCATFMTHEFRLDPSAGWFDYKRHIWLDIRVLSCSPQATKYLDKWPA